MKFIFFKKQRRKNRFLSAFINEKSAWFEGAFDLRKRENRKNFHIWFFVSFINFWLAILNLTLSKLKYPILIHHKCIIFILNFMLFCSTKRFHSRILHCILFLYFISPSAIGFALICCVHFNAHKKRTALTNSIAYCTHLHYKAHIYIRTYNNIICMRCTQHIHSGFHFFLIIIIIIFSLSFYANIFLVFNHNNR